MNERDKIRFEDMRTEAQRIIRFSLGKSRDDFLTDDMLLYAVLHAIEIIGEAANQISDESHNAYPDMPWRGMVGMRNLLIHDYHRISVDVIWQVTTVNIPELLAQLNFILGAG